ncbi:DMT family transporter [Paenibacillus arenilitoris]|uniref:DMT family transporter n=1 Tax=Paenibacillus arenilitoris TaxID=2772299 RepID=A0A927H8C3_9BACL|nr:DMT family transporter [Paenibacillus arenilitoris]MBD2871925.1 DMT family transporter [Paenibacillus arenilitoris]
MNPSGLTLAYLCAVMNALIMGFSFLFTKIALEFAEPLDTLTFRFAASFAVMSVPVLLGRVRLNYRGKKLRKVLLLATLYPLGFFTLQSYGLQHATSGEGGILFAFTPVLTVLLAFLFLKETTTLPQKLSICLSVGGVLFIIIMKGSGIDWSNMKGIILLFLSCLAVAGYSVFARRLLKSFSPAEITYVMLGIAFLCFLAASLAGHATAGTLDRLFAPLASGSFIAAILYLGILSTLVTALSSNYALSRIEASKMSVFSNLSTIVSIAAGALLLGEEVRTYHIAGSALIIAGVMGTNLLGKKSKRHVPNTNRAKAG